MQTAAVLCLNSLKFIIRVNGVNKRNHLFKINIMEVYFLQLVGITSYT